VKADRMNGIRSGREEGVEAAVNEKKSKGSEEVVKVEADQGTSATREGSGCEHGRSQEGRIRSGTAR